MNEKLYKTLNPNIDTLLNPLVPPNPIHHFPNPLAHFLGHRRTPQKEAPSLIQWILTFLATVAGICTVGAVFNYAPAITAWRPPTIVASLGASAVLDYNTIKSPLAQPRNNIFGHTIAALVGVGVAKAFQHTPAFFLHFDWVAAAVACAAASVAMSMTNTVHPPGGATAILACTERSIVEMGWRFPAIMLLASALMLAVALVFNNTLRQYPVFWWTPDACGQALSRRGKGRGDGDVEDAMQKKDVGGEGERSASESTLRHEFSGDVEFVDGADEVSILPYMIRLPKHVRPSDEEVEVLQRLQARLRDHSEVN